MTSLPVLPEAAQLTSSIGSLWRDVQSATSGTFTTPEALERADRALASLLNMRTTEMLQLRVLFRGQLAEHRASERTKCQAVNP